MNSLDETRELRERLQAMEERTKEQEIRAQVEREFREDALKESRERRAFWLEIVKAFCRSSSDSAIGDLVDQMSAGIPKWT